MEMELRDELELSGHMIMHKTMTQKEGIERVKAILDKYESQGINKIGDIPEGADKEEMRQIMTQLGQDVRF